MNPRSPDQLEPRPVRLDRSLGLGSSAQGDRRRPVSRSSARASLTMTNTAPSRAVTWMVRLRGLAAQRRKRWFGRARPRSAALEWGDVPSEREGHPARCDAARGRQAPDRLVAVVSRSHCRSLREQMRGSKEPGTRGRVRGKRRAIRRAWRARRQPARLWPLWRGPPRRAPLADASGCPALHRAEVDVGLSTPCPQRLLDRRGSAPWTRRGQPRSSADRERPLTGHHWARCRPRASERRSEGDARSPGRSAARRHRGTRRGRTRIRGYQARCHGLCGGQRTRQQRDNRVRLGSSCPTLDCVTQPRVGSSLQRRRRPQATPRPP